MTSAMPNIHDDPAALKALQDDIYREKILRARGQTMDERFADGFALTNDAFARMLAGAMWQLGTTDEAIGHLEVRRRMDRLGRVHDEGRFVNQRPSLS